MYLPKLNGYISSLRPWSFTASLCPALLGFALAYTRDGKYSVTGWLFALLTVLSVHLAGNIVNTYYDYVRGFDKRTSDDRTLVDRLLSPTEVASLGVVLYSLGCLFFFILSHISPAPTMQLALLFFGGLSGSFLYTGGSGLKYMACGDLLVFIIFGPISTLFCYVSISGHFAPAPCYYSVPLALNAMAAVHGKNCLSLDRKENGVSLARLLGRTGAFVLYVFLLYCPYTIVVVLSVLLRSKAFLLPLIVLIFAHSLRPKMQAAMALPTCRVTRSGIFHQTAKVNTAFGVLYVISCLLEFY